MTGLKRAMAACGCVLIALAALAQVANGADPNDANDAPYVNSEAIKKRFADVTAEDMDLLRTKKILFASRSYGLNLTNGLKSLATQDKKYDLLSSFKRYDVFKAGGDLKIIPADAFKETNFVHFLCTYWPHTKRMEEMDTLVRNEPWEFGKTADVVMVFFHTALPDNFDQYAAKMDAMQKDYPKVRFIYVTAGLQADMPAYQKMNPAAHAWSEKVRARYKGKAPLYDLGAILSDDFRLGQFFPPEYSKDPVGLHPSSDLGQTMMAKGFILVLRDTFKWQPKGQIAPATAPTTKAAAPAAPETLPPDHPDAKAVRAILDANGLKDKKVEGVSVVENGRVVKLYLQEGGIKELPDAIGQLTELRLLHLYGDRNLPHPLLEKISPAISKCTRLQELLLNDNALTTLPPEIATLTNLKTFSIANNRLKNVSPAVADWLKKLDPKGLATQVQ